MPKNVKRGLFGLFNIHFFKKYQKKLKGDLLETLKIFRKKKSHSAQKFKLGTL